jgi:hypothetical protein
MIEYVKFWIARELCPLLFLLASLLYVAGLWFVSGLIYREKNNEKTETD